MSEIVPQEIRTSQPEA